MVFLLSYWERLQKVCRFISSIRDRIHDEFPRWWGRSGILLIIELRWFAVRYYKLFAFMPSMWKNKLNVWINTNVVVGAPYKSQVNHWASSTLCYHLGIDSLCLHLGIHSYYCDALMGFVIYFENIHFFHAKPGLVICPYEAPPHISEYCQFRLHTKHLHVILWWTSLAVCRP